MKNTTLYIIEYYEDGLFCRIIGCGKDDAEANYYNKIHLYPHKTFTFIEGYYK